MHGTLKEWNVEKWKAFELHKMKRKWKFANLNYNWDVAKFGNKNGKLQRIWNEFAFEINWKFHREKVFDSNEKVLHWQRHLKRVNGGWMKQNLQAANSLQILKIKDFCRWHLMEN